MELPSLETPYKQAGQTSLGDTDSGAQLTRLIQFLQVIIQSIHFHFPFPIFSRPNGKYLYKETLLQADMAQHLENFELSLYCLYLPSTKFGRLAFSPIDCSTLEAGELL